LGGQVGPKGGFIPGREVFLTLSNQEEEKEKTVSQEERKEKELKRRFNDEEKGRI